METTALAHEKPLWEKILDKVIHLLQHIFFHTLHWDIVWNFAFRAQALVKKHGIGAKEARKVANEFFIGFMSLSGAIAFGIIPLVTWLGNRFILKFMPITYKIYGQDVNLPLWLLYILGIAILLRIVIYCLVELLIFGWKSIPQGHVGFWLAGDVPIEFMKAGSGNRLTYPRFDKAAKLIHWPEEISVAVELDLSKEPVIITASSKNAVYDSISDKLLEKERLELDGNDPFHKERMIITDLKIVVIFRLSNTLAFYQKKESMETAKERMAEMIQTSRLQALGKKDYAQLSGFLEVVREHLKIYLKKDLEAYDGCFTIKNVLPTRINFMEVGGRGFKPSKLAA